MRAMPGSSMHAEAVRPAATQRAARSRSSAWAAYFAGIFGSRRRAMGCPVLRRPSAPSASHG